MDVELGRGKQLVEFGGSQTAQLLAAAAQTKRDTLARAALRPVFEAHHEVVLAYARKLAITGIQAETMAADAFSCLAAERPSSGQRGYLIGQVRRLAQSKYRGPTHWFEGFPELTQLEGELLFLRLVCQLSLAEVAEVLSQPVKSLQRIQLHALIKATSSAPD